MFTPLHILLTRIVAAGHLAVTDSRGILHTYGDRNGTRVGVRLHDAATERALALDPDLAAGHSYMQGRLTMSEGSFYDLLALVTRNLAGRPFPAWAQGLMHARRLARRLAEHNPVRRAERRIAHHYDIDPRIYDLFLDADRQYSCAYFAPGTRDIDAAQLAKKRHIAAKLMLRPGQSVLDIGSGWGGLALYLAETAKARVTGITLSHEQLALSRERAHTTGLAEHVDFEHADYRAVPGPFDRIVSVGMFEHVGTPHYGDYFRSIARMLARDGIALLHTIGRSDVPAPTNPFIARHIFPGGALPSLSEIVAAIEPTGLVITDIEVLRLHYAETLRAWRTRFLARRAEAVVIAGEEFARMWEAYLAGAEVAFRYQGLVVFQIQLARSVETVPLTRDYMRRGEEELCSRETRVRLAGE